MSKRTTTTKKGSEGVGKRGSAGVKGRAVGAEMKADWLKLSLEEARSAAKLLVARLVEVEREAGAAGNKMLVTAMRIQKNRAAEIRDYVANWKQVIE